MIDKDIEITTERMPLLTNSGYFDRYHELAESMSTRMAWERVESELPFGLKRFTSVQSLMIVRKRILKGEDPTPHFIL